MIAFCRAPLGLWVADGMSASIQKLLVTTTLAVLLAACQSPLQGGRWLRSEVFFGMAKSDGTPVSAAEWQLFVDEVVTLRFPSGLSIVDVTGQGRVVKEPSKMLVLLYPQGSEAERQIDQIRTEYCRRFNQDAVLKVTTKARVAF